MRLVEHAARALHTAHEAGLVHRDVKPGNIIVSQAGDPVLVDFGLVHDEESDAHTLTETGQLLGTPAYMAPEQVASGHLNVDRRADVYALGVTLYEALTLSRPFDAPTRDRLYQQIMTADAPDPRRANPRIPKDLKVVLDVALDKDPNRRYQTALALAEDLKRIRSLEPIHARPTPAFLRLKRWVQRNRLAAAFLVVVSIALAATIWSLRNTQRALDHSRLMNLIVGRRDGAEPGLRPIMFGSHIDSVPGGGNFDGQVGSMGAVEVATTLRDVGYENRHPFEVVFFTNEEGGKTGSRALAGEVAPFELDIQTASGYTIGEGLRRLGGDPDRLAEVIREPGSLQAFLELHVEQGAVLDEDGVDIGVVEGIVGIMRWNVTVDGMTNHAGTTPMDRRADAMVGAARFVTSVYQITRAVEGRQVATVGRLLAEPGAPNVIPGRVRMTLEIRDLSMEGIERLFERITDRAEDLEAATGVTFTFQRFYTSRAAPTDGRIRDIVERSASELGLSTMRMPSGAGHDAQSIALLCPVGMIFVPSVEGISHAPEEHTSPDDVVNGTNVLLRTLLALDTGGLG